MNDQIVVIVDTREQLPYTFESPRIVTVRRALPAGDYSLDGEDFSIAVERKSLEDYVHTVINDRDRFRRELIKLQDYREKLIVVEGSLQGVASGSYTSGAHPNSVFGAGMSIEVDYGIHIQFCGDRQMARRYTEEWLLRQWAKLQREEKRIAQLPAGR